MNLLKNRSKILSFAPQENYVIIYYTIQQYEISF